MNIAASNPDFPIIMQWTGGRAGGHHSCEDFHQPILATYASIRQHANISLFGGSGFGAAEDLCAYLTGDWSATLFGVQPMPFDGFLFDLILTSAGGHAAPCFRVGLWVSRSSVGGGQSMAGLGTSQVLEASLCRACGQGRM